MFLKQPYSLQGSILFGRKNETTTTLLENPTKITFDLFADILPGARAEYEKNTDSTVCPREVLKFSPPPHNKHCDQSVYRDLTTLHNFGLNVTFHNVSLQWILLFITTILHIHSIFVRFQNPKWLENALTRLDYFVTALSTYDTRLYDFTNKIDAQVNTFSDKLHLTVKLNEKNVTVPNLPFWFNRNLNAKFDRPEQLALSIGRARKPILCHITNMLMQLLFN